MSKALTEDEAVGYVATASDLQDRVRMLLPGMTPKRRRLARLFLDEPFSVAFLSAEEVGRRAGADPATVVRFSRTLGYDGFADLKRVLQARVPQFMTATEKLRLAVDEDVSPSTGLRRVFLQDIANIEATARMNSEEDLLAAVRLISKARATVVLAAGVSSSVARTLTHLLRLMGYPVIHADTGVAAAAEIARLDGADALVAISLWRYVKSTQKLFNQAKLRGVPTLSISDSRAAPIAQDADVALTAATETAELSHSLVGLMSLVNGIATALALENPKATLERLAAVDQIYRDADVTLE
ncbi:MAG: MurR/RpiR family transcriptional regulator [Streptosporangiaceae bacterium]